MESSSDDFTSDEEIKQEDTGLTLTQVNEMVREYEKQEKKERKKNANRNDNVGEVMVDPDLLNNIKISQRQLKLLKPKKPRSEKQIESAKRLVDLRKQKTEEARALKLKVAETRKYTRKPKPEPEPESESESESEEEERPKKSSFQARKPKLEVEEVEQKVQKLEKINTMINNPFYAQIMKSRGIKI